MNTLENDEVDDGGGIIRSGHFRFGRHSGEPPRCYSHVACGFVATVAEAEFNGVIQLNNLRRPRRVTWLLRSQFFALNHHHPLTDKAYIVQLLLLFLDI